jgi:hypothetical protein
VLPDEEDVLRDGDEDEDEDDELRDDEEDEDDDELLEDDEELPDDDELRPPMLPPPRPASTRSGVRSSVVAARAAMSADLRMGPSLDESFVAGSIVLQFRADG